MAGILVLGFSSRDMEFILQDLSVVLLGLLTDVGVVKSALESADASRCQFSIRLQKLSVNRGSHTRGWDPWFRWQWQRCCTHRPGSL